jgi:hypothetical protein
MKYTITLSQEQMQLIANALETVTRLELGQLSELDSIFFGRDYSRNEADVLIKQLKSVIFPELHTSSHYGLNSMNKTQRTQYDLYKQMLSKIYADKEIRNTVHSDEHSLCLKENKIKITVDK